MGNLNLPQIAANQAQKYQTSNDADDYLDLALTATLEVDLTSADATLTDAQFREAFTFLCTGHSVARALNVPGISRPFGVVNSGSAAVSVTCGGSSVDVESGEAALFHTTDGSPLALYRLATGAAPVAGANPYDVGASYPGQPTASLVLLRYPFPRSVTFPAGLTGSRGVCGTTATSSAAFSIQRNGVEVGTMTFGAGSPLTEAVFAMASDTTFAAGDILTIVAPGSPDATLADIGIGLAGERD